MSTISPTPAGSTIDLDTPYALAPEQIARFRKDGFIKLKNVLSPATLEHYEREISRQVDLLNEQRKPMAQRNTYEKAFLQITNLWRRNEVVKEFCFSRRLARIAAELMGVGGVRMYHDQALYKEAGGGKTPWHADQYYWPVGTDWTVTAWIPLQAVPAVMGPLAFSVGSHRLASGRDLEISDESEVRISKALLDSGLPMVDEPFDLGEVSYHLGWTFHRAGANATDQTRKVMTVIYFEDGACLNQPKSKAQNNDWDAWMPGVKIGAVIDSPLNPVLHRA
ncbi:MAG: phytanoyl-CoA dioxygenase family protein [Phycisphaeraceae bacterium]